MFDVACRDSLPKLFTALLLAAGCPAEEEDEIDLAQFDLDLCGGAGWRPLPAVSPEEAVDYLEWRDAAENPSGEPPFTVFVRDRDGTLCGGATDRAACEAAFGALSYSSEFVGFGDGEGLPTHTTLALTQGDVARVLGSEGAVRAFLGDIDAPGDAVVLATLQGHELVCRSGPDVGEHERGFVLHTQTGDGCGESVAEHVVLVERDGSVTLLQTRVIQNSDDLCAVGRFPPGLRRRGVARGRSPVGRFLASVAELEAASVPAFDQLGRELRCHGAPRALRRGAESARRDEIRHARTTRRLARRYGVEPQAPVVADTPLRDMMSVAADNAAEGCVRETFGALVAHAQASTARDPEIRRAMRTIARDETRHAALSWSIARWARHQMHPNERRGVARSARSSIESLRESLTAPWHPEVHRLAGLPEPDVARSLFAGLHTRLLRELEA